MAPTEGRSQQNWNGQRKMDHVYNYVDQDNKSKNMQNILHQKKNLKS